MFNNAIQDLKYYCIRFFFSRTYYSFIPDDKV